MSMKAGGVRPAAVGTESDADGIHKICRCAVVGLSIAAAAAEEEEKEGDHLKLTDEMLCANPVSSGAMRLGVHGIVQAGAR